jgi:hypothetical protein
MMLRSSLSFGLPLVSSLATASAFAREADPERRRGSARPVHVLFDDLVGLRTASASPADPSGLAASGIVSYASTRGAGFRSTAWGLSPSFDLALGERITLGGRLHVARALVEAEGAQGPPAFTSWSASVLPRLGYMIPLNDALFLWPRMGFGYGRVEGRASGLGGLAGPGYGGAALGLPIPSHVWTSALDVTLTARLLDHVLVSLGPEASVHFVEAEAGFTRTSFRAGARASLGMAF